MRADAIVCDLCKEQMVVKHKSKLKRWVREQKKKKDGWYVKGDYACCPKCLKGMKNE